MSTSYGASIQDTWVDQFNDDVWELAIQTQARLRQCVEFVPLKGERLYLDRVGSAEVQVINQRFQDIIPTDLNWDRRALQTERVGIPFFLDSRDELKILHQPKSTYARRAAQAMERDLDRMILASFTQNIMTGQRGTTSITAAADGLQSVDATGGFTYDTLLEIDSNWQKYEIGTEMPVEKYLIISEQEYVQLMKEAELINHDFAGRYVIQEGGMTQVLGMNLIIYGSAVDNPMLRVASSQRKCYAVAKGAVKVGMPQQWQTNWKDRDEKWTTNQLTVEGERGAVCLDCRYIQEITTTAT